MNEGIAVVRGLAPERFTRLLNQASDTPIDMTDAPDHFLVMVARRLLEGSVERPVTIGGKPFPPRLAQRISDIERDDYLRRIHARVEQKRARERAERPICPKCDKPYSYAAPHFYSFTRWGTRVNTVVWTCTNESYHEKLKEPRPRGPRNLESDMYRAKRRMDQVAKKRQRKRETAERRRIREADQRDAMLSRIKRVRLTMPVRERGERGQRGN